MQSMGKGTKVRANGMGKGGEREGNEEAVEGGFGGGIEGFL
jgi:hypothetical protein